MTLPKIVYCIDLDQRIRVIDLKSKGYIYFTGTAEEFIDFNAECEDTYENYRVCNMYTTDNRIIIEVINKDEIKH